MHLKLLLKLLNDMRESKDMTRRRRVGKHIRPMLEWLESRICPSSFYTDTLIAQTGQANLTSMFPGASINDAGKVAFQGNLSNGQSIFVGDGSADPTNITPTFIASNRTFGGELQINNNNQVADGDRSVSAGFTGYLTRIWDANSTNSFTTIARGAITDPKPVTSFDALGTFTSISNDGNVAFAGLLGNNWEIHSSNSLVTANTSNDPTLVTSLSTANNVFFRQMAADNHQLVLGWRNTATREIDYYNGSIGTTIAQQGANWADLGVRPGISDDGSVITFYGELTAAGATALTNQNGSVVPIPLTPGKGVFASVHIGTSWYTIRIAGEAHNGHLDPGERLTLGNDDVGPDYNYDGNADWEIGANGFAVDSRVGVSALHDFSNPAQGSYVDIVYVANDTVAGATQAIYSSRLNLFKNGGTVFEIGVQAPIEVVRAGETLNGVGSVTGLGISDPVNKSGQVAFWASGSSSQGIYRADPVAQMLLAHGTGTQALPQSAIDAINGRTAFDPDSPLVEYIAAGVPSNRSAGAVINQVIVHATAGSEWSSLQTLTTSNVPSVHYLIDREGRITEIVPEAKKANHAGTPAPNANDSTIGIEVVDDYNGHPGSGTGHREDPNWLTPIQQLKLARLVRDIAQRNGIPLTHPSILPATMYPFVSGVNITNGGTGYTSPPTVTFGAPAQGGTMATGTATIAGGKVTAVTITNAGGGYLDEVLPAVTFTGGGGHGAAGTVVLSGENGDRPSGTAFPAVSDANYTAGTLLGGSYRDGYGTTVAGIIEHGQILNRTDGKDDPRIFPWTAFMAQVTQGIVLTLHSPANLFVIDPQGRRAGVDPATGQTILEIPGAVFSGADTEPETLSLPPADGGSYTIQVVGTGTGAYHLDVAAAGLDSSLFSTEVAGTTAPGQTDDFTLNQDAANGSASTLAGSSNLAPVASDDTAYTNINTPAVIAVLTNDTDADGTLNPATVTLVSSPANGSAVVDAVTGAITYTPAGDFSGTDSFTYTVEDNLGLVSNTASVSVLVSGTGQPPQVAVDDVASTTTGKPVAIDVLANDSQNFGAIIPGTVTVVSGPAHGTTTVDSATGAVTYTPAPGFTGSDSFTYTVLYDEGTQSNAATVGILVNGNTPTTSDTLAGTLGNNGWYTSAVTVTFSVANAPSGVAATYWSVDGGSTWQTYTASFDVSNQGNTTVEFYSVDNDGNTETVKSDAFKIDTIPPELQLPPEQTSSATQLGGAVVDYAAAGATDDLSTPTLTYSQASGTFFPLGTTPVHVTATDDAGNQSSGDFNVTVYVVASKLTITTAAQKLTPGAASALMSVQLQDNFGNVASASSGGTTLSLGTTSSGGAFLDASGNPLTAPTITIDPGSSGASFEYEDSNTGTPTLTVAADGLTSATQDETVLAKPVISWTASPAIAYGTVLSAAELNAAAADATTLAPVAGTFVYTPAAGAVLDAGSHALNVSFTPLDTSDYTAAVAMVMLDVERAAPSFSNLSTPVIAFGTSSTTISGRLQANAGAQAVPAGQTVQVTLDGVTQDAALQGDDTFSVNVATGALIPAAPHTISFSYQGDTNFKAVADSSTLTLSIPPLIVANPASQKAGSGQTVSFTAAARGFPAPSVQWLVAGQGSTNFVPVPNNPSAALPTLVLTAHSQDNGNQYKAVFTSNGVSVTTTAGTLTVSGSVPAVNPNGSPTSQSATAGQKVILGAQATGSPTPGVQWQISVDGGQSFANISGATSTKLTLKAGLAANGFQYRAAFSNRHGVAYTAAATLTVNSAPVLPPTIITPPTAPAKAVNSGQRVTFAAAAQSADAVQWQTSTDGVAFTALPGATALSYGFPAQAGQNGWQFRALFSNPFGQVASTAAVLSVNPAVTKQPVALTLYAGQTATFKAAARGNGTPSVQWQVSNDAGQSFGDIAGASLSTLSFVAAPAANGQRFRAVFTSTAGSVQTQSATQPVLLTVKGPPAAPVVLTQPLGQIVLPGETATFTAAALARTTLSIQWQVMSAGAKAFTSIPGATANTLMLQAELTDNGNKYRAVFTNSIGPAMAIASSAAVLTVGSAPMITAEPANQTVAAGKKVTFAAAATGSPAIKVQWQVSIDGGVTFSNVPRATSAKLTFVVRPKDHANLYRALFTNPLGQVATSAAALLAGETN